MKMVKRNEVTFLMNFSIFLFLLMIMFMQYYVMISTIEGFTFVNEQFFDFEKRISLLEEIHNMDYLKKHCKV